MAKSKIGVSFYLFDFDDNIMFLATTIIIRNTITGEEKAISTGDFPVIRTLLGQPGAWENYAVFDGTFRNFRDVPKGQLGVGRMQPFVEDVEKAASAKSHDWRGPSWDMFAHACAAERPVSIVTARGHSPKTIKDGIQVLVDLKRIVRAPKYLTVFPVGCDSVRRRVLDDAKLELTIPALKRRAIIASVDRAVARYGAEAPHRFGMSDDDPRNVDLIIRAMCECKTKHITQRFFVINTHRDEHVKLEVFPADFAVAGKAAVSREAPLG